MAVRMTLFTIGHSTRSIDEVLGLLAKHRIETLVDVRRFPGSRRHPPVLARGAGRQPRRRRSL
jgi:uncharacterized protein (DUF488 family)